MRVQSKINIIWQRYLVNATNRFEFFDLPAKLKIIRKLPVLLRRYQHEIFKSVVSLVEIQMMYMLGSCKRTTDGVCHDQSVFKNVSVVHHRHCNCICSVCTQLNISARFCSAAPNPCVIICAASSFTTAFWTTTCKLAFSIMCQTVEYCYHSHQALCATDTFYRRVVLQYFIAPYNFCVFPMNRASFQLFNITTFFNDACFVVMRSCNLCAQYCFARHFLILFVCHVLYPFKIVNSYMRTLEGNKHDTHYSTLAMLEDF